MKKTAIITAAILLCISLIPVQPLAAGQGIIHREVEETKLSRNVVYKSITQFTDLGWEKIHVLEGDISDRRTRLELLTPPQGIGTGSTLPEMIKDTSSVAAINGDFFISGESYSPIGPLVKDGEMQSSPTYRMEELAVFSLDNKNIPVIDYWKWDIVLKAKDAEFPISAINKISFDYAYPIVYTREWGDTVPPATFEDILYVVVNKDRVTDIIQGPAEEVTIPAQGMVVMVRGDIALEMLNILDAKASVKLETISTPDYEDMKLAVGGGSILVKNGSIHPFTHSVDGSHPRTALGFSRNGDKIIAVAVEGRTKGSKGMTQLELAQLMADLGAYQAINLDGGGSTTMLTRNPGDDTLSLANVLSDGSPRRISNGISINSNAPKGSLRHILVQAKDTNVFVSTGRTLTVKGYDSNYNPISINQNRVSWSVAGVEGSFDGNVFYPSSTGNAVITASYLGQSAQIKLKVLDTPVVLSVPDTLKADIDRSQPFNISGKNLIGYTALIENKDLNLSSTIGSIKGQSFLSGSREGTGQIQIAFNQLQYTVPVSVGYQRVVLDGFESPNGSFASYPDTVTGHYVLDIRYPGNGRSSGRLAYDFSSTDVTAASYLVFNEDGITLDKLPERIGLYAYSPVKNSHWLRMVVEDSRGKSVTLDLARKIDWTGFKFVHAQVPRDLTPPISIKKAYIVETNPIMNDTGEIYLDDLTAMYPHDLGPSTGNRQTAIYDPGQVKTPPQNYSFSFDLFGGTEISKLIDIHIVNRHKKLAEEGGSLAVFAGVIGHDTLTDVDIPVISTKAGYSATKYGSNTFLQLDNHSRGLRTYSPEQWHWFKQQLDNIDGGNLFVVLPRPVWGDNGLADTLEAELLHGYLSDLYEEKGVTVYVLCGGWNAPNYDILDGIKYIGINGTATAGPNSSALENYSYIRFFIGNSDEVSYQILQTFPAQ